MRSTSSADFVSRFTEILAELEVQLDLAVAFRRRRVDADETGHGADGLLDRSRDQLFHLEWTDAGIGRAHRQRRLFEFRHQIDRKSQQREESKQRDDRADHEHRDRAVNG
jgi:hypothetical protein